jgi:uncharacterized protein
MSLHYLWIGFAGGALAFVHCLGMCGGFALHLSRGGRPAALLGRQLTWHVGKTFTYVFLGAIAGFGGRTIQSLSAGSWIQTALAYAVGAVIVLMGLTVLGLVPAVARAGHAFKDRGWVASLFSVFFQEPTAPAALALGVATGFLPCPIVLAFLAYAVNSGSVPTGMLIMGALGAGTLWSLLLLGMTGHLFLARLRRWGAVVAGVILIALGAATALRGTSAFHRVLGCPATSSGSTCCKHEAPDIPAAAAPATTNSER